MTTATASNRTKKPEANSVSSADVLRDQAEAKRRALGESTLYARIVRDHHAGKASDSDVQAARILAGKWGWQFDADIAALQDLSRIRERHGDDIDATASRLWGELTAQAEAIRTLKSETDEKLHKMEVERQDIQKRHSQAVHARGVPAQIQAKHPHLFPVDAE